MILLIILVVLLANMGSILLAAFMLKLSDDLLHRVTLNINALAGGTLLGAAFIGMLPKAFSLADPAIISYLVLCGIMFFFILEKVMIWRFCNAPGCDRHSQAGAQMLLMGGGFHSMLDGIIIAASLLNSFSLGIVIAVSILGHEIARQIGNFGVLLKAGYPKRAAFLYNMLAGAMSLVGAGLAAFFAEKISGMLPYIFAFSAAGFIYVSLADLIPELHQRVHIKQSVLQFLLLLLGISVIVISITLKP